MRLINTSTLRLYDYFEKDRPLYAILSHTWSDHEISYAEYEQLIDKEGIPPDSKIAGCCKLAAARGWEYIWVDTCCIDKSSSAELTEAINSMYKWYENAGICFVYLADFSLAESMRTPEARRLEQSRWFTRGWTLQELLAPKHVHFYDQEWVRVGSKTELREQLSKATMISHKHLSLENPRNASSAAKMSWASRRDTTRSEDLAYCLLGLFSVNMPLLYGEGERAFIRLQQEIIASSEDESIFAWRPDVEPHRFYTGILAPHPSAFKYSNDVVPISLGWAQEPYTITNKGLKIVRPAWQLDDGMWGVPMACSRHGITPMWLKLERQEIGIFGTMARVFGSSQNQIRSLSKKEAEMRTFYVVTQVRDGSGNSTYVTSQLQTVIRFIGSAQTICRDIDNNSELSATETDFSLGGTKLVPCFQFKSDRGTEFLLWERRLGGIATREISVRSKFLEAAEPTIGELAVQGSSHTVVDGPQKIMFNRTKQNLGGGERVVIMISVGKS